MNPYELNPNVAATMLGRAKLFRVIKAVLTKPSPDHVSLVGPRLNGKTTILRQLQADPVVRGAFSVIVHWDLRRATPGDDESFRRTLAELFASALRGVHDDLIEEKRDDAWLKGTIELVCACTHKRVLVVLDGIDAVLRGRSVTRHVWDNLKAFGDSSVTFVCASRDRLVELCDAESSSSDFWDMFTVVQQVGAFEESDWGDLVSPLSSRRPVEESARKALIAWSGGNPRLACELLHHLHDATGSGPITKSEVDAEAEALIQARHDTLTALWRRECDELMRGLLYDLATGQAVQLNRVAPTTRERLSSMGFIAVSPTSIRMGCGLMSQFAKDRGATANHLRRLFADEPDYARNIGATLELRLAQVRGGDAELRRYTSAALRSLSPEDPMGPWRCFRDIVDRALVLIYKAEGTADGRLSDSWKEPLGSLYPTNGRPPKKRGISCRCLDIATGNDDYDPVAQHVTKRTVALLDAISTAGDVTNHKRSARMPPVVSVHSTAALCAVAVELFAAVTEEIPLR